MQYSYSISVALWCIGKQCQICLESNLPLVNVKFILTVWSHASLEEKNLGVMLYL